MPPNSGELRVGSGEYTLHSSLFTLHLFSIFSPVFAQAVDEIVEEMAGDAAVAEEFHSKDATSLGH
jgi:hypothetical protein